MSSLSEPYEVHLTVADHSLMERTAVELGLKPSHIVLERGKTPSQPMLSWRGPGPLDAELTRLDVVVTALAERGIPVLRAKVEASPDVPGVPQDDDSADSYFEQHIVLELVRDGERERLLDLLRPHGAHLSRNARRADTKFEQRFVTQRAVGVGWPSAERRFEALCMLLKAEGYVHRGVHREYVFVDTRQDLDAGWLS